MIIIQGWVANEHAVITKQYSGWINVGVALEDVGPDNVLIYKHL